MKLTKVIITIPKDKYEYIQELEDSNTDYATTRMLYHAIKKGTPLDSNSERAEVQAYFAGESYGWEQGRKALIDDVKAEIGKAYEDYDGYDPSDLSEFFKRVYEILDNIVKAEKGNM